MDKIAIIGTGYMARIIASRAKELGVESHCFSNDSHSVAAEVADYFHYVNILDVDELLRELFYEANIQAEEGQLNKEKEAFYNKYLKKGLLLKPVEVDGRLRLKIELEKK